LWRPEIKPSTTNLAINSKLPILANSVGSKNLMSDSGRCCTFDPVYLLIFCLVSFSGCGSAPTAKQINTGRSVFFSPDRIRTIAIMPLNGTNTNRTQELTRELTVQILQLNRFEVVDHYKVATLVEDEGLEGIDLSDTLVKNIARKLQADAILLGEITNFQEPESSYPLLRKPPFIGLSLRIVSINQTMPMTIWSMNDTFDSRDRQVKQYVKRSERRRLNTDPYFLIQVVAKEIAKTFAF